MHPLRYSQLATISAIKFIVRGGRSNSLGEAETTVTRTLAISLQMLGRGTGVNPPIGRKRIPARNKATPVGAFLVRPGPPGLGEMEMIASANPIKTIAAVRASALSQINQGSTRSC
jgi:hypothetical protein